MNEPSSDPLFTLPETSRRYGIGLHSVRRAAKSGHFPVYSCGTAWPRVKQSEFEAWLDSTQIRQRRVVSGAANAG